MKNAASTLDVKYDGHDFTDDVLKPHIVLDHLKAHDERMRNQAPGWALAKAMYTTNYWRYMRGDAATSSSTSSSSWSRWVDVEVNRLFPFIGSYLASLYPRAQRSIMSHDPQASGDPEKAGLAANRWLATHRVHQRIMTGIRQALLYPGSGAKLGFSPGRGTPLDRVWLRIIPWWEIVLDFDANDVEDERFRGHVFYQVKEKVEEEYGITGLKGTRREDFLDKQDAGKGGKPTTAQRDHGSGSHSRAKADQEAFVRVLEIVNLVDTIRDENDPSIEYQGRLEVYVLGQPGDLSKKPLYMGPLPFAKGDGRPLPHIVPLIFNHEPEFPFRGIPHSARVIPQIQELNAFRAHMAMATRKDVRQWMVRKGVFNADTMTKITEGEEGLMAEVEADYERPLNDAMAPIPQQPLNSSMDKHLSYVEMDLDRGMAQSPQARGEVTKATAFEIQTVQQYTESEFGMHAALKDHWLAEILRVFLRALIAAMQDVGDYRGAFRDQEIKLAEVGAEPVDGKDQPLGEDMETEEKNLDISEDQAMAAPYLDSHIAPALGVKTEPGSSEYTIEQEKLVLRDHRDKTIEISVEDLDAEFDISFVEGGRTPLTDAAMQQNLVALMQPLMALWEQVQGGGPPGVLAKAYMQVIAERFDLPRDLYPEELESKLEQQAKPPAAEEQPQPGPQEEGPQGGGGDMTEMLQKLLQLPPQKALQVLAKLFQDNPEMMQTLQQISQMSPEQQAVMIEEIVTGLLQAQQGQAAAPGPQAEPQAEPPAEPPAEPAAPPEEGV